ncbi:MAG TPA: S8 family serine peptidase [Candidatus Thermoplasmatota archaeon]|nr:S8 family serine peptidase [Candidatus Thermoplasmatota archaeon]
MLGRAGPTLLIVLALLGPLAAAHPGADGRYLVTLEPWTDASALPGLAVVERFESVGVALVRGAPSAAAAAKGAPGVLGVYPVEPIAMNLVEARRVAAADVAPPAGLDGAGVTVAIVDSGLDLDHPGFKDRVEAALRFRPNGAIESTRMDDDGHGTHIAGVIAGSGAGSSGERLRGFAPGARLVALDISDEFTTANAVRAFEWLAENHERHNIRVVSNSWGREKADAHYDRNDPVIRASDELVRRGIVVVFSAGNKGADGSSTLTTEASNPNVITVGAVSKEGRIERYSSRGPAVDADRRPLEWTKPDVVAAGTHIVSARSSQTAGANGRSGESLYYVAMNGTSMAAPQAAGAAALLLSRDPSLKPAEVRALLQATARDAGGRGPDPQYGYGILDVAAALDALAGVGSPGSVVVERRVPFHDEGRAVTAAERLVLTTAAPSTPDASLRVPLVAPAGADRVDAWFNWSGPGAFVVFLDGPGGARLGPFTPEKEGAIPIRAKLPKSGVWTIDARPSGPVGDATWVASGNVVVLEQRQGGPRELPRPVGGDAGGFLFAGEDFGDLGRWTPWRVFGMLALVAAGAILIVDYRRRRGL